MSNPFDEVRAALMPALNINVHELGNEIAFPDA